MSHVFVIARNELRRIFVSPLAWAVLALFQFVMGFFVFMNLLIDYARNADYMDQYTGVSDSVGAGLLSGVVFYVAARMMNS